MSRAVVGIDPGVNGAMALMATDAVVVVDWPGDIAGYASVLGGWSVLWDIRLVALEKVAILPRDSKRSGASFMRHVGEIQAMLKLVRMPYVEVLPCKWMKGLVPAKNGPRDKPSVKVVERLYPSVPLAGPRGGIKDGRADAILIARWALTQLEEK